MPICPSRSGYSITAGPPDSAPTRCQPPRRSTSHCAAATHTLGVLAVRPAQRRRLLLPEQQHLLETFAGQIGLAIERASLAEEAEAALVAAETESLRNTLLASISHDLRTPLAVIAGASSALADPQLAADSETRMRLATTIESKAQEMSKLISNVLDLMRFESGEIQLRLDWQTLDDLVGTVLGQLHDRLVNHPVDIDLPDDLPAVRVDAPLIVQVFANLLDNCVRHTLAGTRISISASTEGQHVRILVDDNGPGLPPGDPEQLFKKFQRGREESNTGGAGLGLAICRAIIAAHGGAIFAAPRPGGGTRFEFTLPTAEPAHDAGDVPGPDCRRRRRTRSVVAHAAGIARLSRGRCRDRCTRSD